VRTRHVAGITAEAIREAAEHLRAELPGQDDAFCAYADRAPRADGLPAGVSIRSAP
jgi:hypothetical protein